MRELILDDASRINYVHINSAQVDQPSCRVMKAGRDYIQFSYFTSINKLTRMIKLTMAVAITVLTAFVGLFSKYVRNLWAEALKGKDPLLILTPFVQPPSFVAKMHVPRMTTGYIGKKEDGNLGWPTYWDRMTLENGDPLPLDPTDFAVSIEIHTPQNPSPTGLPSDIFLPYKLLETVRANDKLRLKFDGALIELEADQNYYANPGARGNFEDFVGGVATSFRNSERSGIDFTSLFQSGTNDLFFYTLGNGGTIFSLALGNALERKAAQEIREIEDEHTLRIKNCVMRQIGDKTYISAEVPGAAIEDIDVIINQKFIVIYSKGVLGEALSKVRWDIHPLFVGEPVSVVAERLLHAEYNLTCWDFDDFNVLRVFETTISC